MARRCGWGKHAGQGWTQYPKHSEVGQGGREELAKVEEETSTLASVLAAGEKRPVEVKQGLRIATLQDDTEHGPGAAGCGHVCVCREEALHSHSSGQTHGFMALPSSEASGYKKLPNLEAV